METDLLLRIIILIVLILTFSISAYYRRQARETGEVIERREEGTLVLILRMAFGLIFLAMLTLNIFFPSVLTWSKFEMSSVGRIGATVLAVLCVPLIRWVFQSIGRNISETVLTKGDHALVTHGAYARIRHPLYTSSLLLFFSVSVTFGDWIILSFCLIGVLVFRFLVIPAEEQKLIAAFGEQYEDYMRRTGAIIPKL